MPGTVPASAGTYSADVTFTPTNTAYASVSGQVNVTVNAPAPADLSTATIGSIADQAYTGQAITPNPVVTLGSATLTEGTDYTASYLNNTNVGKATLTIPLLALTPAPNRPPSTSLRPLRPSPLSRPLPPSPKVKPSRLPS